MLREIHELLGIATVCVLTFTALLGLVLFFFSKLRGRLPLPRSTWLRGHRWGSAALLFFAAAHILTTDRYAVTALAGAATLGVTGLVGLSLRRNRQHFRKAVRVKMALVALGAVLLAVGHTMMEAEREAEERAPRTAPLSTR